METGFFGAAAVSGTGEGEGETVGSACCANRDRVIAVQRAEMITTVFFMWLERELMFSL